MSEIYTKPITDSWAKLIADGVVKAVVVWHAGIPLIVPVCKRCAARPGQQLHPGGMNTEMLCAECQKEHQ